MPGVKHLHQDSDNSGKGEYIYGHHIGFVGLLIGCLSKAFCLPMHGQLHEGVEAVRPGEGINGKPATIVTRMAYLVVQTALNMGCPCYVALDAYFSTGPAFLIFKAAVNDMGEQLVHIVTRAKDNYVCLKLATFTENCRHFKVYFNFTFYAKNMPLILLWK